MANSTVAGKLVEGAIVQTSVSDGFRPIADEDFNIFISGTFSATAAVVRSYDDGATWIPVLKSDLTAASLTTPGSLVGREPVPGTIWALQVTWASGSVVYRFQQ